MGVFLHTITAFQLSPQELVNTASCDFKYKSIQAMCQEYCWYIEISRSGGVNSDPRLDSNEGIDYCLAKLNLNVDYVSQVISKYYH